MTIPTRGPHPYLAVLPQASGGSVLSSGEDRAGNRTPRNLPRMNTPADTRLARWGISDLDDSKSGSEGHFDGAISMLLSSGLSSITATC